MSIPQERLDIERNGADIKPLDGFPSLAAFIASDHDRTSLVFKRFDKLAARNLLYIQSELAELQARQDAFDAEDQSFEHGDLATKRCAMSWEEFREVSEGGDEKQRKRMELVDSIRKILKEYREALLFESTLAVLKPPPSRTFDSIHHAFTRLNIDEQTWDPILAGYSAELYSTNEDLVLLKQPQHEDRFTTFVQKYLALLFASEKRNDDMRYVPEQRITRFVSFVSIVIAVVLLYVAIISLYIITSPKVQLIMIGVYMLLFAVSVGLFTTAKRSEIFAATAAYAAVLVVFVGGPLGSNKTASKTSGGNG